MFTKADSLLGRSLLEFARVVDRHGVASATAVAAPRPG
jgi:hypothetical protein